LEAEWVQGSGQVWALALGWAWTAAASVLALARAAFPTALASCAREQASAL
jgi:hypothetical protein